MEQNDGEIKFVARESVDRRKIKDRRSCLELEEYFSQNPERRTNMTGRREIGERRELISADCMLG